MFLWTVLKTTQSFEFCHRVKPQLPLYSSHKSSWHQRHSVRCARGLGKEPVKPQQAPERRTTQEQESSETKARRRKVEVDLCKFHYLMISKLHRGALHCCRGAGLAVRTKENWRPCILFCSAENIQVCSYAAAVRLTYPTLPKRIKSRKVLTSYWPRYGKNPTNRNRS